MTSKNIVRPYGDMTGDEIGITAHVVLDLADRLNQEFGALEHGGASRRQLNTPRMSPQQLDAQLSLKLADLPA